MKRILFLGIIFLGSWTANAQNDEYKLCNEAKVYTLDHHMLTREYKKKPLVATTPPKWPKGQDSLQQWFDVNLRFHVPKEQPIQRVIMALTVDCNGNPGDFRIVNKNKWPIEEEMVKTCIKSMGKWIPATLKGKPVDAHTIIFFSVANSKVTVKYKE